ncbi:hypothetical protein ACFV6E_09780 [Streptomyces sp. NPDC059785]|uniref:hypothetical protein n=1 Tax=unclassified Streptomyces TaxID=2593676 RepID=UPI003648CB57
MTKFLLAVHVIAAIVAIGPVTVAASMFPPTARKAFAAADASDGTGVGTAPDADPDARSTLRLLHRICRVYATLGVVVPVFGFATASNMGVLGDTWLIVSIALTAVAAVVLAALVLPRQTAILESVGGVTESAARPAGPGPGSGSGPEKLTVRLAMFTGIFNLLWAVVTVLMIIRPGSTTGA